MRTVRKGILLATAATLALGIGAAGAQDRDRGSMSGGASVGAGSSSSSVNEGKGSRNFGTQGHVSGQTGGKLGASGEQRGHANGEERNERGRAMGENRTGSQSTREEKGHAYGEERNEHGRSITENNRTRDRDRDVGREQRGRTFGEERTERNRGESRGERRELGERRGTSGFAESREHGRVSLSGEQRTRIHDVVIGRNFGSRYRVERPDFDVRVGTVVPRHFHLFTVPEDIVEVVPRFRGYQFFEIDDEVVIVDPVTLEIVDVILS